VIRGETKPTLVLTPNPVNTTLRAIFLSALQEQVTINIYNANGLLVKSYTKAALQGTNTWEFDVSTLPIGIYSVIVKSPHQLATAIFFKQ
jgi:flagellar hook assembly protein FlgD